jgi:hypothetical protein
MLSISLVLVYFHTGGDDKWGIMGFIVEDFLCWGALASRLRSDINR